MSDTMERFIVMDARASMPSSCFGGTNYRRIAVVELDEAYAEFNDRPAMISERALGVVRLVETWERLHVGKTARGAFQVAMLEAIELCAELNAAPVPAPDLGCESCGGDLPSHRPSTFCGDCDEDRELDDEIARAEDRQQWLATR